MSDKGRKLAKGSEDEDIDDEIGSNDDGAVEDSENEMITGGKRKRKEDDDEYVYKNLNELKFHPYAQNAYFIDFFVSYT